MGVKWDIPPANNMKFIIDKSISTDEDTFAECLRESDSYTKGSKGRQDYIDNSMERLYRFFKNMVLSGIKFQGPTLDVASGWGILYPCFRKYFRDMLPYFIAELNCCEIEYDGERIPNVKFEFDKEELPIEDSKFGVIVFCDILEHLIVDPVWTILELNRVLKRGHHLIINTPNAAASIKILDICAGRNPMTENHIKPSSIYQRHNREYTPDEIQKLMECCGFGNCIFSTNDYLVTKGEIKILEFAGKLGALTKSKENFGPELFCVAEKIEHRTIKSALPKEQRWPEWLYTSFDSYRKRPEKYPVVVSGDYA